MEKLKHIFVIAEAGVNHNGSLELARELVDKAKEAGADCIKFQTFIPERLVTHIAPKAQYQCRNLNNDSSQLEMLRKLSLPFDAFEKLKEYCTQMGIMFLSTPFDSESIDFLDSLEMQIWKIPSGELTNMPYLEKLAKTKKPVILSTGMSTLDEIYAAIYVLKQNGSTEMSLLHCTTEYPAPFHEVNLRAMHTMMQEFSLPVGYSDHTPGITIPIAAAAMGAKIIEKHFTLDRTMEGPDHRASLEPGELKTMVEAIKQVEAAMGDGVKKPSESELKNMDIARKSIVAKKKIHVGEIFTEENITTKRPGNGISPMKWHDVLGQAAVKTFEEDDFIQL